MTYSKEGKVPLRRITSGAPRTPHQWKETESRNGQLTTNNLRIIKHILDIDKLVAHRIQHGLGARFDAELGVDITDVVLDGGLRERELIGDIAVALALREM